MKAIIVAAGLGSRLKHLTADKPKCLLPVKGTTLLGNLITRFKKAGINDIAVVRGYLAHKITEPDVTYFLNDRYAQTNILHSLMYARDFLQGDDVLVSYADIWLEDGPIEKIIKTPGDVVISVDQDWRAGYGGTGLQPDSEAEKALYDTNGHVTALGKHIHPQNTAELTCSEFIGLMKISRNFCDKFRAIFDEIGTRLANETPFQQAKHWRIAYITDFIQELINRGHKINVSTHHKLWKEVDTIADYEYLLKNF